MYFDFLPGSGNKNLLFQHMRHNSKFWYSLAHMNIPSTAFRRD
jgi:hypothetical protein